ncbi:hypothetical protein AB0J35_19180 [Nonomuraea angiospora]|uniref:hypothetical protein n=1 Tax=Nonomuraea angiospora TaxID=46172 RepID=UPI0034363E90
MRNGAPVGSQAEPADVPGQRLDRGPYGLAGLVAPGHQGPGPVRRRVDHRTLDEVRRHRRDAGHAGGQVGRAPADVAEPDRLGGGHAGRGAAQLVGLVEQRPDLGEQRLPPKE